MPFVLLLLLLLLLLLPFLFVNATLHVSGNYLLNVVGMKAAQMDDRVSAALVKVVCLALKLSWIENSEQTQEIMQQLAQFLQVLSTKHGGGGAGCLCQFTDE